MQLLHRRLQQLLPRRIGLAELAHLGWAHHGISGQSGSLETLQLPLPGSLHTFANRLGILHIAFIGQLFVIDSWHLHVNIDTNQERAADLFLVAGDGHGGTTTFFDGIAVEATGAPLRVAVVTNP